MLTYFKSGVGYTCNELLNLYIHKNMYKSLWCVVYYRQTIATFTTFKSAKAYVEKGFNNG